MTENEWRIAIGKQVRVLRKYHGLTQAYLAQAIGANSAGYICDVEHGRRALSGFRLWQIQHHLGPIYLDSKSEVSK